MLSSIIRYIRDWQRYGRDVQELSRLSDPELADIGSAAATSAVSLGGNRARQPSNGYRDKTDRVLARHRPSMRR